MNLTGTWPFHGDPRDPWADEGFPETGFPDYRSHGGRLERPAYEATVALFRDALHDLRTGAEPSPASVVELASTLLLDAVADHESHFPPMGGEALPTHAELARIATDLCPAGGGESQDRLLGPLAEELDHHRPAHRATALAALAAFCFTLPDGSGHPDGRSSQHGRTPFEQWARRKPIPPIHLRADVRAVARSPVGIYTLERTVGDRWLVSERSGLAPHTLPDGPVGLREVGAPWREPRPGDLMVARIAPMADGWQASCALVFPTALPLQRLRTWVRLSLWEARLVDRRLTQEDLQRRHAHTLIRRVSEWAWLHGDEDPYRDAVLYDLEYAGHEEDCRHYAALAKASGGPVLELGCGTGRLSVAMARTGVRVDGLDLSPSMLAGLDRRLTAASESVRERVRAWQADFRDVAHPPTQPGAYPLVVWPFNALHHCQGPEEIRQVLDGVRQVLAPGGRLAVDCYLPAIELYDRDPAERIEERDFVRPDTGEVLTSWEQGWWDPERRVHHVRYVYRRADGTEHHTQLQLRMYPLSELLALFREAGWTLLRQAQDFEGAPVQEGALKWVGLLEPAAPSR